MKLIKLTRLSQTYFTFDDVTSSHREHSLSFKTVNRLLVKEDSTIRFPISLFLSAAYDILIK